MKVSFNQEEALALRNVGIGGCFVFINIPQAVKSELTEDTVYMRVKAVSSGSIKILEETILCVGLDTGKAHAVHSSREVKLVKQDGPINFKT